MFLHPSPKQAETIAHFAQFAGSWWDPNGPFQILHTLTPLRLRWIKNQLCTAFSRSFEDPLALQGLRILDIGCGGGLLCEPLARMGALVTGIDPVSENIETARHHGTLSGLPIVYHHTDIESFASKSSELSFDVALGLEVIEHTENPAAFIAASGTCLRPGGLLLLSTLNKTFQSWALGIFLAERILKWVPPGTHAWSAFITPSDLAGYLKRAALTPGEIQGLSFSLLTQTWHLSSDTAINYFISARKESPTP